MKKQILFFFLITLVTFSYSQVNDSKIKIDSSKRNEVTVLQTSIDSSTSDIDLNKSDSNKISIQQGKQDTLVKYESLTGYMANVSNTTKIFVLLTTIATFIGLLYKGFQFFKKTNKKI